jgi:ribonuclease HI
MKSNDLKKKRKKKIIAYIDGACSGNPGPGGWAAVLLYKEHRKELSGKVKNTTNNRMELTSAIKALQALKESCKVTIYSDSKYLVDSMNKGWVVKWKKNKWMRNNQEPVLNVDLWKKLLKLCEFHEVKFQWISGHSGIKENERCNYLAVKALKEGRD